MLSYGVTRRVIRFMAQTGGQPRYDIYNPEPARKKAHSKPSKKELEGSVRLSFTFPK